MCKRKVAEKNIDSRIAGFQTCETIHSNAQLTQPQKQSKHNTHQKENLKSAARITKCSFFLFARLLIVPSNRSRFVLCLCVCINGPIVNYKLESSTCIINCIGASRLQDKYHREIAINRPATISTRPKRTNSIYDLTWQSLFCFVLFFWRGRRPKNSRWDE